MSTFEGFPLESIFSEKNMAAQLRFTKLDLNKPQVFLEQCPLEKQDQS